MAIQAKVFERVLNMAQMHQIGVLHRGPNMLWTCRWNEGGRQSSMCYELLKNPYDTSMKLRFRYYVMGEDKRKKSAQDYTISLRVSRSYKQKTWYWFICPLIINGKACKRRVRNLYFLPNSEYFGCKHCRDMMVRSIPQNERMTFWQTVFHPDQKWEPDSEGFIPELNMGWRPSSKREICQSCGCLSEGAHCCHCGKTLNVTEETNHFEILGLSPTASYQDVRVAFTTRLKEYHPDRVAHLGKKLQKVAEQEIKHINLAYETLKDPKRRVEYMRKVGKHH